jgi:hypothetical protein
MELRDEQVCMGFFMKEACGMSVEQTVEIWTLPRRLGRFDHVRRNWMRTSPLCYRENVAQHAGGWPITPS